jgi:hypothetical protein
MSALSWSPAGAMMMGMFEFWTGDDGESAGELMVLTEACLSRFSPIVLEY